MANDNTLIMSRINQIQELVENSPIPRVGSSGRRIVDYDEIIDMLVELKTSLPENVRRANSVILEADKIIDDAETHARSIADSAAVKADDMVAKAEREADRLSAKADGYFDKRTQEADMYYEHRCSDGDAYYDERIANAEAEAERIIADATSTRTKLISESEITVAARAQAEDLRNKTVQRSNQVYTNAKISADNVLEQLMSYLEEYYDNIKRDREALNVKPAVTEVREQSRGDQSGRNAQRNTSKSQYDEDDREEDEEAEESVSIRSFFNPKRKKRRQQDDEMDDIFDDDGENDDKYE